MSGAGEPLTVWVVTTGEYSSYAVNSVWASQEDAEAFAERLPDANDPFEETVRSGLPERVTIRDYMHTLYPNGGLGPEYLRQHNPWCTTTETWAGEDPVNEVPVRVEAMVYPAGPDKPSELWPHINLRVVGSDLERVDKVFSERVAWATAEFDVLAARAEAAGHAVDVARETRR